MKEVLLKNWAIRLNGNNMEFRRQVKLRQNISPYLVFEYIYFEYFVSDATLDFHLNQPYWQTQNTNKRRNNMAQNFKKIMKIEKEQ